MEVYIGIGIMILGFLGFIFLFKKLSPKTDWKEDQVLPNPYHPFFEGFLPGWKNFKRHWWKIILGAIVIAFFGSWLSLTLNNRVENSQGYIDSSWLTYENKDIGLSIKYPPDWLLVETQVNPWDVIGFRERALNPGDKNFSRIYISLKDNPNNLSLRQYYRNLSQTSEIAIPDYYDINTPISLTVDGFEAVQFSVVPGAVSNTKTSILLNQGILEIDRHNDYEPAVEIYDAMLDSLTFDK